MKFLRHLFRRNSITKVKERVIDLLILCFDQRKKTDALNSSLKQAEQTLRSITSALDVISLAGDKLDDIPAANLDNFLTVLKKAKKLIQSKEDFISPEELKSLEDSLLRFRCVDIGHLAAVGMMKSYLVNKEKRGSIGKNPVKVLRESVSEVLRLCSDKIDEITDGQLNLWLKGTELSLRDIEYILTGMLTRGEKLDDVPAERMDKFVSSLILHVKALVSTGGSVEFYDMVGLQECLLSFCIDCSRVSNAIS